MTTLKRAAEYSRNCDPGNAANMEEVDKQLYVDRIVLRLNVKRKKKEKG